MIKAIKKFFASLLNTQTDKQVKEKVLNNTTLIDVRNPEEFSRGSAINAINIPLSQIESRASEIKKMKEVIVFCKSGMRSARAKAVLKEKGFSNVINGGTWRDIRKIQEDS